MHVIDVMAMVMDIVIGFEAVMDVIDVMEMVLGIFIGLML